MEYAILVMMGLVALLVVTFIMMLVTRSELGALRRELEAVRQRLRRLEAGAPAAAPDAEPARAPAAPSPAPSAAPPPTSPPVRRVPRVPSDFEKVVGGQWLTWLGVLAIFLGTAFFLAVDLGASALAGLPQVLIAAAVAAGFLVVGRALVHRAQRYLGLGLLGGGIALLDLAAYGLFGFHRLVGAEVVFPALLAVAFLGALVALAQDARTIAALTLTGALLTPLVLAAERGAAPALLPYLIAVDLGAVLVARRRGWAGLALGSFAGTALLISRWWGPHYEPAWRGAVLAGTGVIWLLYGVLPWLGRVRPGFWGLARTALVAANGAWYAAVTAAALAPDQTAWRGTALLWLGMLYVAAAVGFGRRRRDDPAVIANFYTGAALVVLAVPVQFDGLAVALAWALVGLLLLIMGWRLDDPHHRLAALAGLLFSALRLVGSDLDTLARLPEGYRPLLNQPFLADLAVVAALLVGLRLLRVSGPPVLAWERRGRRAAAPAAAVAAWWALTAEAARWMAWHGGPNVPLVTVPLAWALYAVGAQWLGARRGLPWLRGLALASLAGAALGAFVLQALQVEATGPGWRPVLNGCFLAGAAAAAVLAWTARRCGAPPAAPWERRLATPLLLATLAGGLVTATLELLAWFGHRGAGDVWSDAAALLTISLFWTLYGGAVVWGGFAARRREVRLAGMALLGLVILKVFAVDGRTLTAGYRIGSFVGVGVLLLVVSLLYQRERRGG